MNSNTIDWTHEFNSHLATFGNFEQLDYFDLDGTAKPIKCFDAEHKGKTYYKGEQRKNTKFGDYPFITVSSQAHGLHTIATFDGYRDVLSDTTYTPPTKTPEQLQADKVKADAAKRKAEKETKDKAASVKRDIESFNQLSKTPTQSQDKYLTDKKIQDFIKLTDCDIRYGTDKHGHFSAILLISSTTGQTVGVQKFYDHKIEYFGNTNKLFTKGMSTSGACYQIGTINNTTKDMAFCEGLADAILLYILWGIPAIVTLDAGNIGRVTSAYKAKYPNASGVVVLDDDKHNKNGNVGVTKGMAAAQQAGYAYVIPDFTDYDQSGKPTDVWDLWDLGGNDAIENLKKSIQYPQIPSTDTGQNRAVVQGDKSDAKPIKQASIPHGYRIQNGCLFKVKITHSRDGEENESLTLVYKGKLEVLACEIDADTKNHKLSIQFQGNKSKLTTVSVPLEEVATGRGIIANLAKRGAKIQEQQAKLVSEYLIRFYEQNDAILPTNSTTQFLGISGNGIITPLKSVGTETKYNGALKLAVGTDKNAYPNAIKEIVSWGEPAWPLLFTLSMSLISPFLPRLKLRRNPVIAFLGQSNSGKTTSALFANGVWGDSERAPLKIDGSGNSTQKGIAQTHLLLNGLPWLLDEIHKMKDYMIESTMYEWANKQTRVIGTLEGIPKGGTPLHGTLLLCGENLPQLKNKGATNRLLMIDVATNPPLGVSGKIKNGDGQLVSNPEGARRAKVLEHAWMNGMGLLGADFSGCLINNWDNLYTTYQHNLKNINGEFGEWAATVAISITTLEYLFTYLGINDNSIIKLMPAKIAGLLHEYRNSDKDPDIAAWDNLQTMVGVASEKTEFTSIGGHIGQGVWQLNGEIVWWYVNRQNEGKCYAIPTNTEAFKRYIGQHTKYSQSWLNQGLIIGTGKDDKTITTSTPKPWDKTNRIKCLIIPVENNSCHQRQIDGDKFGDKENPSQSIDNKSNIDTLSPMSPMSPSNISHAHTRLNDDSFCQVKSDDDISLLPISKNDGDNGDNGDKVIKTQYNQPCILSPDLSPTLSPAQNQAVVFGGHSDLTPPDWFNELHSQSQQTDNDINKPNGFDNNKYPDFDDIDNQSTTQPQVIDQQESGDKDSKDLFHREIDDLISKFPGEQRYEIRQEFERKQRKSKDKAIEWLLDVIKDS